MPQFYPGSKRALLLFITLILSQYIFAQPVINSLSPTSGPAGLQVVIRGANFSPSASGNMVVFGAVQGQVLGASADSLRVRVPIGATTQPMTVMAGNLTGYSYRPFRETFSVGGVPFSAGSFAGYTTYVTDGGALSVGDMNGDGKTDVVSGVETFLTDYGPVVGASPNVRSFSVMSNHSDSGNLGFGSILHFPTSYVPYFSRMADMDGDGKQDVVAWDSASSGMGEITVYRNTGSGGTISFNGGTEFPYRASNKVVPLKMILRDFDGDGKIDVLTSHEQAITDTVTGLPAAIDYFTFLQNTGTTGNPSLHQVLDLQAQQYYSVPRTFRDFLVEDFDGDGKPDILALQYNGYYVYLNTSVKGTISFTEGAMINYITPGSKINFITAGDVDGDGMPDIVYTNSSTNQVNVCWNNGQPGYPAFYAPHAFTTGSYPDQVVIGDLDGDGKPELVVGNRYDGTVSVFRNQCIAGKPMSTQAIISFDPKVDYSGGDINIGSVSPYEMYIADMDGDRRPDIVIGNRYNTNVNILRNLMSISPAPVTTSFSPTTATAGSTVTIRGSNFTGTQAVSFGGVPAASYTVFADSIMAVPGSGSTGNVVVTTLSGSDTAHGFTYVQEPSPIIYSFSPTSGSTSDTVLLKGLHFTNVKSLSLGNVPVSSFNLIGDTLLVGVVGAGASGDVVVTTTAGSDTLTGFTYIPQMPVISSFTPTSGKVGDTILVRGTHLSAANGVSFGGVSSSYFHILDDNTLYAVVGYGGSTGAVTVSSRYGSGSLPGFTFTEGPHLYYFYPSSGRQGDTIMIIGQYLNGVTSASFGGVPAQWVTPQHDTTLWAVVGAGASGKIVVSNPYGSDSIAGFTFIGASTPLTPPHINSFTPGSGMTGTVITISGQHFSGTTAVYFGGTSASSFTVVSDSSILAVTGYGTTGYVKVVNRDGVDSVAGFTYVPPPAAPAIIRFNPTSAVKGATVQIHGTALGNISSVSFGDVPAQSFTIVSDTLLSAVVGVGASGEVVVSGSYGMDSVAGFVFLDSTATVYPSYVTLTGFSPASAAKGATVVIRGTAFTTGVTTVSFGHIPAQSFTVVSDTLLYAVVGTGASGQVFVSGLHGQDSLQGFIFVDSTITTPVDSTTTPAVFKLAQFNGIPLGNQATLQWETYNELSITRYVIEQSTNNARFTAIDSIKAQGVSPAFYSYVDSATRTGINFYRLKMEDTAGNFKYSNVVAEQLAGTPSTLGGYPNPASGSITVAVPSTLSSSQFELIDMNGHSVRKIVIGQNVQQVTIDLSGILKGVYKLVWSNGTSSSYQSVLILN